MSAEWMLPLAMGSGWGGAVGKALEYGLIAVLFVLLLRWVLVRLDKRMTEIEAQIGNVTTQISTINDVWSKFIHPTSPLGVTNPQARRLFEISLDRDMYALMDHISGDLLYRTNMDEHVLSELLQEKTAEILGDTRKFLAGFRTSKGSLSAPLEGALPMSERLNGDQPGDLVFKALADELVRYLKDDNMDNQVKLIEIKALVRQRRNQTEQMLRQWLEGVPPAPRHP